MLTEIYRDKMGSPPVIKDILTLDQNAFYSLKSVVTAIWKNIRVNKFGFNVVSTIGSVLWAITKRNKKLR